MDRWKVTIRITTRAVKVLVTDSLGEEMVRARLPLSPDHPRSLLTLLEGLALWNGAPVTAAISVADGVRPFCGRDLFGGTMWPGESALVRLDFVRAGKVRRLRGLGSFRDVIKAHGLERRA